MRKHLEASGDIWFHLEASGVVWRHPGDTQEIKAAACAQKRAGNLPAVAPRQRPRD